jgi:hypothetical protein
MANKKAEIKSKKRTVYLHENLFNEFSNLAKKNGSSASSILNGYMKKVVDEYNGGEMQSIFD